MAFWFGRMLTFEVEADESPVGLGALLNDASGGAIEVSDARPIGGFAAHGSSVRDTLESLVELSGLRLREREGRLRTPEAAIPQRIADDELGCDADGKAAAKAERVRAPDSVLPASLAITFYDPDRDYQAGQARASSGQQGLREDQVELPAVMAAGDAKQLAENALSRRWLGSDQLKLRLPPSRMDLRPGDMIQLAGEARAWSVSGASIEGMAVVIEAGVAPVDVQALPADGGRPVSEPDLQVGRSELVLFELPTDGDAPGQAPRVLVAASNKGLWRRLPVELALGSNPMPGVVLSRCAVMGRAETVLHGRAPVMLDELSSVTVRLFNDDQILLNADLDALVSGANLAALGDELIQFGIAERLGEGLFRLSRLLRGRRGTEWAAGSHAVGDDFCMIDPVALGVAELPTSAVGATLNATAHGIGDIAPLPQGARLVSGEAMRPPSPCQLSVGRDSANLVIGWVRRSHRHWAWIDGIGEGPDSFPELYRIEIRGPNGTIVVETSSRAAVIEASWFPGDPGQSIDISVATIGPVAASRPATATIVI